MAAAVPHTRRQNPRYSIFTQCVVVSRRDQRLLADQTVDVSWSGVQVRGLTHAPQGEPVDLALRLPDSDFWVEAEGWVTRVIAGRRVEDQDGRTFGVRVSRMNGMNRVLLGSVIRNYPRARARRGGFRDYAREVARIFYSRRP